MMPAPPRPSSYHSPQCTILNSQNIKSTLLNILEWEIQWHVEHPQSLQPSPHSSFRTFPSPQRDTVPIKQSFLILLSPIPATTSWLSVRPLFLFFFAPSGQPTSKENPSRTQLC